MGVRARRRRGAKAAQGRGSDANVEGNRWPFRRYRSHRPSIPDGRAAACERQGKSARAQGQAAAEPAGQPQRPMVLCAEGGCVHRNLPPRPRG